MVTKEVLKDREKDLPDLDDFTTPIWNKEMGDRFRLIRKRMLLDQSEMAKVLGVTQSTISKLETGKIEICGEITIKLMKQVFDVWFSFIVINSNPDRLTPWRINQKYHFKRFVENRKNRSKNPFSQEK